jgi:hypothetical protein
MLTPCIMEGSSGFVNVTVLLPTSGFTPRTPKGWGFKRSQIDFG